MNPHTQPSRTVTPPPTSPEFARTIAAAFPGTAPSLLGAGEAFAAWLLAPTPRNQTTNQPNNQTTTARAPYPSASPSPGNRPTRQVLRVQAGEGRCPLTAEAAALKLLDGKGAPALHEYRETSATSEIGLPYLLLDYVPGRVLPPQSWNREMLTAYMRMLAALHRVSGAPRGGADAAIGAPPAPERQPYSLAAAFAASLTYWESTHPQVVQENAPIISTAKRVIAGSEPYFTGERGPLPRIALCHGDACATNVLWPDPTPAETTVSSVSVPDQAELATTSAPIPALIDFEWAMFDDVARDLAILAGPVYGGPWYVPLPWESLAELVGIYVAECRRLRPDDDPEDTAALMARIRGRLALERTDMLLHLSAKAEVDAISKENGGSPLATLRQTLTHWLG
ncbi:aminoglycoside phosphotransferase family protein [Dermabacteraceae bacterium CCM 9519]